MVSPKKLSQHSTISKWVRCSHVPEPACRSPAPGQWSTEDEAVKWNRKLLAEHHLLVLPGVNPPEPVLSTPADSLTLPGHKALSTTARHLPGPAEDLFLQ